MATRIYEHGSLAFGFHSNPTYQHQVDNKPQFKKDFGHEAITEISSWMATQGVNDISHWEDTQISIEDGNDDDLHESQEIIDTIDGLINPNGLGEPKFRLVLDIDDPDVRYVWFSGKRICLHGFKVLIMIGSNYAPWVLPSTSTVKLQVWATLSWETAITATGGPPMD